MPRTVVVPRSIPALLRGLAVALTLGGVPPAAAFHTVFDFQVERAEVDGNVFGAADGVPDLVDEFERELLGDWFVLQGTVFARDGVLHLTNPGTHVANAFGAVPGYTLDISQAYLTRPLLDGSGAFTAAVHWTTAPLRFGDFEHFSLFAYADPANPYRQFEVLVLAISNPIPEDDPPKYAVNLTRVRFADGSFEPLASEEVPVDPDTLTGPIVFRFAFDDDTNQVEPAFSLDGGASFTRPFAPAPFFQATGAAVLLLGVDPIAAAVVPPAPLCTGGTAVTRARAVVRRGKRGLDVHGRLVWPNLAPGRYDPVRDGAQLHLSTRTGVLLDLTGPTAVPPGERGSGCGSEDGWHRRQGRAVYRNLTGALPPACAPGSARGLRRLALADRLGRRARFGFALHVDGAVPPAAAGPLELTVVLGSTPDAARAGACAAAVLACEGRPGSLHCR